MNFQIEFVQKTQKTYLSLKEVSFLIPDIDFDHVQVIFLAVE